MLKMLFSSAVRAEILSLLLKSPEDKYYVREIAKLLQKNPSAVKRELDNLEKMGLVRSEKVANLKYFQAETSSPLYAELTNLITKSLGLTGNLKGLLRSSGVKTAFIYGPYAEGLDVKTLDLFLVTNSPVDEKALRRTAKSFGQRLVITKMDEEEYREKRRRRDKALLRVLEERRIPLLGRV
jgi:DNA-binding transcriptional ArsR family regulator